MRGFPAGGSPRRAPGRWGKKLHKAAALGVRDWAVLLEAVLTLLFVQVALRSVGFSRLLAWVRRTESHRCTSSEQIERIAWLVTVVDRATRAQCLPKSLTLAR